jgi:pilus assembly protein FimV
MTRFPRIFKRSALCAALSLSALGSAQALTLSSPHILSKQGEPLSIEVDVLEMSAQEQLDFKASLANPEIYKAASIDVPSSGGSPLEIQVRLLRRDNGKQFLEITSKQPVTGNFVDLMLDLRWSTGRSLRDLNLSLDEARPSTPKAPLKAAAPIATQSQPTPAPATPKPTPAPAVEKRIATNDNAQQITVEKGDTASAIAAHHLGEGISLDQMLIAMLRSNPDAFVDDNVNRLKAGAVLNLPTQEQAAAIKRSEAHAQIVAQSANFSAYRAELAARAPGGVIPKASRNTSGKLEAQVQNKKANATQDTLKLTKPNQKAEVEAKVAKQLEAQEVASRAAEISRNIAELGKIAQATASDASASSESGIEALPNPTASQDDSNLGDQITQDPTTIAAAGGAIAALVLIGLWVRKKRNEEEDDIQGLPPLNVKFDLNLQNANDKALPEVSVYGESQQPHATESFEHLDENTHEEPVVSADAPAVAMPNISLDLEDEPVIQNNPFKVRMDLANELWQLGQLHTSRALMEEVLHEASGEVKVLAQKWLAERG